MRFLRWIIFACCLNPSFVSSSFDRLEANSLPEEVLRVGIGTVPIALGLLINAIMSRVDMVLALHKDPAFREISYKIQDAAIEMQRFGNWLKNRASTGEVCAVTAATALAVYLNSRLCCWAAKKAYSSLSPFKKKNRGRLLKIAAAVVALRVASAISASKG